MGKENKRAAAKKKQPKQVKSEKGKDKKARKEPDRASEKAGGLLSAGDIGKIAGVPSNTVHHWKDRDPSFPKPVSSPTSGDLYRRGAVMAWLRKTGRTK